MKNNYQSTEKKAIKAGLGYTIGNILVKGISFLSLPIFARLLTVSDYGIVNTFNAYTSILFVIIGFALHASIRNAKIDYPGRLAEYCSSVTVLPIINAILLLVVALAFSGRLAGLMKLESSVLVPLLIVSSFGMMLVTFYNGVLSADYRSGEYISLALAYAIVDLGLSIFFILCVFREQAFYGRIMGTVIASAGISVFILIRLFSAAKPKINAEFWKYGLKISLPIVPHGLSQIVLAQFDRLMIQGIIGSFEAGMYSFAYNVGIIYQVIASSLDTAWSQWFFDRMEQGEESKIRKTANIYALLMAVAAIGLMLISPELITLLGGKKYADSRAVAIPIVLAMFYAFMYYFPAAIEYYYKKTKYIAIGTMSAAVLNIVLNALFIRKYGYVAAAYTTVACYLAYYVFHVVLSTRVHGSTLYDMKIHGALTLAVTGLTFLILAALDRIWIRYGIVALILAAAVAVGLRNKEKVAEAWKEFRK